MSSKETPSETDNGSGKQPSAFPVLSGLALFAALVAAGVAAWSLLELRQYQGLPSRVEDEQSQLFELQRRIEILAEDLNKQQLETRALREQREAAAQVLDDVPVRLEQVEKAVASIPGMNPQSRSKWLKSEALYYLRVANAQALLSENAELTVNALELADDKLREAGDPAMARVRARISEEITVLQSLPQVDRTGISFRLQSVLTNADDWPFRSLAPDSFAPELSLPDEGLSAWDRFVATVQSVLRGIVNVKETDEAPLLQLSGTEKALIVEGVKAELQVSRLAFATNNTELFAQSLSRAGEQLEAYFDTESPAVRTALDMLAEIQATEFPGALPDITGSLSLMLSIIEAESAIQKPQATGAES
ncbi:MAG: uroporphyrinogen-III C-methyltransferase [Gammaproteobacteria bacterium]